MKCTSLQPLLALLALCALLPFTSAQFTLPNTYNVSDEAGYYLSWGFDEDFTTITVQVVLFQEAWVGICFHNGTDTGMTNGDFVVASFTDDGQVVSVDDRWAPSASKPSLDSSKEGCSDNLLTSSAVQVKYGDNIQTILTFQRLLNTGDPCDCPIVNDTMNFSYAWGQGEAPSSNTFGSHGPNNGMFSLNLFTFTNSSFVPPPPSSSVAWQGVHGTIMLFSFAFLMTLGVFLPRYLKEFWWWFPLHIIIQVSAVVLSLIGFTIAVLNVESQFGSWHAIFGAITLFMAFVSPFLGTAAHFMWKPSRSRIPLFPDVLHWWIARLALVMSYCTIFLGMALYSVPIEFVVGFICVLLSYAFVFGFLDIVKIKELGFSNYFSLRTTPHSSPEQYNIF